MSIPSIIITILISMKCSIAFACSCLEFTPFFSSVKYSQNVVEGVVIKHQKIKPTNLDFGYNAVLFQIKNKFNGAIKKDTILIAESTGFECYSSNFEDGKSYFVHGRFTPINKINTNGRVVLVDEIFIPSECTESTILIQEDEVCGKISVSPNKLNRWFYKLTGKLKKIKSPNNSAYVECMNLYKLRKKLKNVKFKN